MIRALRVLAAAAFLASLGILQVRAQSDSLEARIRSLTIGPSVVDSAKPPARPDRGLGADTNSAQGYFETGMLLAHRNPALAARAFYWAARIDPSSGDALYALHATTILSMSETDLRKYMHLGQKKRSQQFAAFDSMDYRAHAMNPFVFGTLDPSLLQHFLQTQAYYERPHATPQEVGFFISAVMGGEANFAWIQYSQNHLQEALATYAKVLADTTFPRHAKGRDSLAITKHRKALAIEFHAQRGRIFYLLGNMDSAQTEISSALDGMRAHDDSAQILFYLSKAMYEQALGMIYQRANKMDLAREAYGHALEEDLAFYPAHNSLAQLDLARHDTAGALAEMDLAVLLAPNDPVLRYHYAEILVHARRDADAAAQLRKSIALDPYYGAPHLMLALIADVEQYTEDAIGEYTRYISVASRTDQEMKVAQARLKELTATVASNPAKP